MDAKPQQSNIILNRLDTLPPELKEAIFSNANAEKMADIGKQHGLLIDKVSEMTNETGLLMLGLTHPNDFVGNLAERLLVDRQTASKIADDINREVFAPVREHLRALFGISTQKEASEEKLPETERSAQKSPSPLHASGSKFQERSSALSAVGHQSMPPTNSISQQTASLEDLEAELERALAEEKGIQPLSVVKKPVPVAKPTTPPPASYKGVDPYREQVGEDLPNIQGKAYAPQSMEQKKDTAPEQVSGFKFQASRTQPTPAPKPVEERSSPFSPLGEKTAPPQANRTPLSAFRGFKMNNAAPETKDARKDVS